MNRRRQNIVSEIKELESILASMPEEDVIERRTFEARLHKVSKEFESTIATVEPERTRLTFRGAPVFGSSAVAAEFGAKAAGLFADAFSTIAAGHISRINLAGPIPNKIKSQLMITGVATGSFGFEFELPRLDPTLFSETGGSVESLEALISLFERTVQGTDDEVAEVVHSVPPRALKKIVEFLGLLSKRGAWCGLEFKGRFFRYNDLEEIKIAKERLSDSNVRHETKVFIGNFEGSLPKTRTFQFKPFDYDEPIIGRFDPSVEKNQINEKWLGRTVNVQFDVLQVGEGRPRYTLQEMAHVIILE